MEIDNAIFYDLENFGQGRFAKMAIETFWISVWGYYKVSL